MNENLEDSLLQKSLKDVEKRLEWGASDAWTTRDFTELSERIYNKTGVVLSVSTLKRLWGKVQYTSKPTTATLNALVQFMGYENWQSYVRKHTPAREEVKKGTDDTARGRKGKEGMGLWRKYSRAAILTISLLGVTLLAYYFYSTPNDLETANVSFEFSSRMMESEGVPNSVLFNYDASAASPQDSVFIQQSWDARLRERVSPLSQTHQSIYYYPGFFQAKLLVNNQIVKEHALYIKTNGWLPLVEQEGSPPVYFHAQAAGKNPSLFGLSVEQIEAKNVLLQPKTPWISYFNVRKFGGLKTDNFVFSAKVKNDYKEGAAVCQNTEIHLLFEGGAVVIPLAIKGCVGNLSFYDAKGKIDDTEALGCNLSEWVSVEYKVRDKKGILIINDKPAYENLSLDFPALDIVGIRFRFQGTGSVSNVKLETINGKLVYTDFKEPDIYALGR